MFLKFLIFDERWVTQRKFHPKFLFSSGYLLRKKSHVALEAAMWKQN